MSLIGKTFFFKMADSKLKHYSKIYNEIGRVKKDGP